MDARKVYLSIAVHDQEGKGHGWRWNIVSEKPVLTKALIKEINETLKYGRKYIVRELKGRRTNPFAWSPGPTQ